MGMTEIKDLQGRTEDTFCGQLIRILKDKDRKWIMYQLIDGTGEISLFSDVDLELAEAQILLCVNCWIRSGEKGLSANLGRNGKILTGKEIESNPLYQRVRQRLARKPVIFINDIRQENLQKVQLAAIISEIYPTKKERVESKKLVAKDITGQNTTLMFHGEDTEVGRGFHEGEFFVINGLVQRFKNTVIINLGPDGRIFRGRDARETPAGKKYFDELEKNDPEVLKELMRRRKNLQVFVKNQVLTTFNFNEEINKELLTRLGSFLFRRIYLRRYWTDSYFNCLKEIQTKEPQKINPDYKNYLLKKIKSVIELSQDIFDTYDESSIEAIIGTLYDSTIDMETFNTQHQMN